MGVLLPYSDIAQEQIDWQHKICYNQSFTFFSWICHVRWEMLEIGKNWKMIVLKRTK